jgi:hypothetical protein
MRQFRQKHSESWRSMLIRKAAPEAATAAGTPVKKARLEPPWDKPSTSFVLQRQRKEKASVVLAMIANIGS